MGVVIWWFQVGFGIRIKAVARRLGEGATGDEEKGE